MLKSLLLKSVSLAALLLLSFPVQAGVIITDGRIAHMDGDCPNDENGDGGSEDTGEDQSSDSASSDDTSDETSVHSIDGEVVVEIEREQTSKTESTNEQKIYIFASMIFASPYVAVADANDDGGDSAQDSQLESIDDSVMADRSESSTEDELEPWQTAQIRFAENHGDYASGGCSQAPLGSAALPIVLFVLSMLLLRRRRNTATL